MATISEAPAYRAATTARVPIGPQPVTSTFAPSSEPARRAACRQTARGSAIAASDIVIVGAIGMAWPSSTVMLSRKPPWTCGKSHGAAHEPHVEALVVLACAAIAAFVARLARVDGDPHASRHQGHLAADFIDRAGNFVPKRHRLLQPDRSKAPMMVIMQVGTANPAGFDPDPDITRSERGRRRSPRPEGLWDHE